LLVSSMVLGSLTIFWVIFSISPYVVCCTSSGDCRNECTSASNSFVSTTVVNDIIVSAFNTNIHRLAM